MARTNLLDELKRRPLLCDGAMGTQLMARGLRPGECGELWNAERPAQVEEIHRAYIQAGCDLVTTNTFGGSPYALRKHNLEQRTGELNWRGAHCAMRAAEAQAWVLGDIGPFGDFLEPLGETTAAQLLAIFAQQAGALQEAGVDGIIVETMSDPAELEVAVKAARGAGAKAVLATYAFAAGGDGTFRTMMGVEVKQAISRAVGAGADVVGANCGSSLGLGDYLRLAEQIVAAAGGVPVIVQPNAGSPVLLDGKLEYRAKPADMATAVPKLLDAGVRIIGGCCGTTPEHLRAMAAAMRR